MVEYRHIMSLVRLKAEGKSHTQADSTLIKQYFDDEPDHELKEAVGFYFSEEWDEWQRECERGYRDLMDLDATPAETIKSLQELHDTLSDMEKSNATTSDLGTKALRPQSPERVDAKDHRLDGVNQPNRKKSFLRGIGFYLFLIAVSILGILRDPYGWTIPSYTPVFIICLTGIYLEYNKK